MATMDTSFTFTPTWSIPDLPDISSITNSPDPTQSPSNASQPSPDPTQSPPNTNQLQSDANQPQSDTSQTQPNSTPLTDIDAKWAIAIDGDYLTGNSSDDIQPTASTAKMITALAVMEKKPFSPNEDGETITITESMVDRYNYYLAKDGTNSKVSLGGQITEREALETVLLVSSNNMADSLAEWAFGSLDAYHDYATEMLAKYGLTQTTIGIDASGFSPTTTSTARELAKIGELVLKNPVLKEIVATKETTVPMAGTISNTNLVLGSHDIAGVKTGWIGDSSGYCLVSGYFANQHAVTIAVIGAHRRVDSFTSTLDIVETLQGTMSPQVIAEKDAEIGYYYSWWTGRIPVVATTTIDILGTSNQNPRLTYKDNYQPSQDIDGTITLSIGDRTYEYLTMTTAPTPAPNIFQRFFHALGWSQ